MLPISVEEKAHLTFLESLGRTERGGHVVVNEAQKFTITRCEIYLKSTAWAFFLNFARFLEVIPGMAISSLWLLNEKGSLPSTAEDKKIRSKAVDDFCQSLCFSLALTALLLLCINKIEKLDIQISR